MSQCYLSAFRGLTEKPDRNKFHMHTHGDYEVFCFLSGDAKYYIEGTVYTLRPRDILLIKKGESHTLLISKNAPYERIVINFNRDALCGDTAQELLAFLDNRPLGQNNCYPALNYPNRNWQFYLDNICHAPTMGERQLYLTVLLQELYRESPTAPDYHSAHNIIKQLLDYINDHLCDDINLDALCNSFHISKTHINRLFKKYTGSTVWEYVKIKRLLRAKTLLQEGLRPTAVCAICGFHDYSAFYYAYRAKFGINPNSDRNRNNN